MLMTEQLLCVIQLVEMLLVMILHVASSFIIIMVVVSMLKV